MNTETYTDTANTLKDRTLALIPDHPEILDMDDPGDLFQIEGFDYNDLGATEFQAQWALDRAKMEWKERHEH